jgi:hypothetical protein
MNFQETFEESVGRVWLDIVHKFRVACIADDKNRINVLMELTNLLEAEYPGSIEKEREKWK